jgi:hypothetical protein
VGVEFNKADCEYRIIVVGSSMVAQRPIFVVGKLETTDISAGQIHLRFRGGGRCVLDWCGYTIPDFTGLDVVSTPS